MQDTVVSNKVEDRVGDRHRGREGQVVTRTLGVDSTLGMVWTVHMCTSTLYTCALGHLLYTCTLVHLYIVLGMEQLLLKVDSLPIGVIAHITLPVDTSKLFLDKDTCEDSTSATSTKHHKCF